MLRNRLFRSGPTGRCFGLRSRRGGRPRRAEPAAYAMLQVHHRRGGRGIHFPFFDFSGGMNTFSFSSGNWNESATRVM
jgi:hypothetical protein